MLDKSDIHQSLVHYQEEIVNDFKTLLSRYQAAVDVDDEDTKDIEDLARQGVSSDMAHSIELQLVQAESDMVKLKALSLDKKDSVSYGAVVVTENFQFYISIANHSFKVGDEEFIGLASDAPVYMFMKGKKAGDSFSFNKRNYTIKQVY